MTKPRKIRGRAITVSTPVESALGKVLTTKEAAEILRTTSETVLRAIAAGQLKAT